MKRFAACLPLLVACGDGGMDVGADASVDASVDAYVDPYPDPYPCWPDGVAEIPHGSLELGGGRGGFHE